jgi:hypothetical protein
MVYVHGVCTCVCTGKSAIVHIKNAKRCKIEKVSKFKLEIKIRKRLSESICISQRPYPYIESSFCCVNMEIHSRRNESEQQLEHEVR